MDGYTVFVDGALPEEVVQARFYEKRKSFGRASVVRTLKTSSHRVQPPCPVFGRCGGCQIMHLSYPQQLEYKRQRVIDALERIGKLSVEVFPCESSPKPLAYRNKIQLPVDEKFRLGLYARNSHDLVPIERCYIHSALGEKVFSHVQKIIFAYKPVHLRHVLIKTAVKKAQVLVVLVTVEKGDFSKMAQEILAGVPEIKGVVQNINGMEGNVVLGGEFLTLAGSSSIEEEILGLRFKVSPASFFQVNPEQAEKVYQKVLELSSLTGKERVLDAYCGVGTLSLLFARRAQKVTGVECASQAIEDAKENREKNGILNAEFHLALAEDFMPPDIDIAVLNPPRKGCGPLLLEKIAAKKIFYISCDPATLARDLAILVEKGYRINGIYPFDMFPQTAHVETLAFLEKI